MEHAFAMGSGASFAAGGSNTTQLRGSDFRDSKGGRGGMLFTYRFSKRGKKKARLTPLYHIVVARSNAAATATTGPLGVPSSMVCGATFGPCFGGLLNVVV